MWKTRLAALADINGFLPLAPDLAAEVISPSEIALLDETAELAIDDVVPGWRLKLAEMFQ